MPSWVLPDTIAANAQFLSGKVPEIGLCLFETAPCLAYTPQDLPANGLPLRYHVHLPLDLDWHNKTPESVFALVQALMQRVLFLAPHAAILHPPCLEQEARNAALWRFATLWQQTFPTCRLLLENTKTSTLVDLDANLFHSQLVGICLDFAHLCSFGQEELYASALLSLTKLCHWSAPAGNDRHQALTRWTQSEQQKARYLWPRLAPDCVHMLEIFSWQGVLDSLPILAELCAVYPHTNTP